MLLFEMMPWSGESLLWVAVMSKEKLGTKARVHRKANGGSHPSSDSATVIDPVLLDVVLLT